ncbi:MAG: Bcr/CflA family efflux MFS transporter [Burkholderiales bacterium]|nr:Bcr/CflA family efflux MFS transporter [Burkholderiales bacterium]
MSGAHDAPSFGFTLLLGLLIGLTALGMDMFLPALPELGRAMAAAPGAAQLAVTTYLAGLAAGQLAWGPVSDRMGRRPALLAGLALFLFASVACAAAQSLAAIALLRFAQGVGMSSGPVIARSIVRDLYAREQAAQLLGRMTAVFGLIPVFGPLVGAQVLAAGGWRAVFGAYAAVAALLLAAVWLRLPETAGATRAALAPARLAHAFVRLLADARFVAPLATALCAQMAIIAFVSNAALVAVHAYALTPGEFSLLFSAIMLGQMGGGYWASRLVARRGVAAMVRSGVRVAAGAGTLLAVLALAGVSHWAALGVPMLAFILGCAFVIPNATAAALAPFPALAGTASSLLGVLPFGFGALVSAALGAAFDGTAVPMACTIAVFGAAALAAERLLFRRYAAPG